MLSLQVSRDVTSIAIGLLSSQDPGLVNQASATLWGEVNLGNPSAAGNAIGRPYLALFRVHSQAGVLDRLVLNCSGGSTAA